MPLKVVLVAVLCYCTTSVECFRASFAVKPQIQPAVAPRVLPLAQAEAAEPLRNPRNSMLDSTDKFDDIAAGAATAGSAAAALGKEPGTCDPFDPKSSEYCMDDDDKPEGMARTIKLGVLFFAWYFLNTAYNIGNKLVLTAFPMPWTAATWELFFGFPYVFVLWTSGLRKAPKVPWSSIKLLAPSGVLLAGTHVGGVISFGLGAISFTHVLKATEPVWSALISAVCFRDFLPLPVYASLVPIIAGVSLVASTLKKCRRPPYRLRPAAQPGGSRGGLDRTEAAQAARDGRAASPPPLPPPPGPLRPLSRSSLFRG